MNTKLNYTLPFIILIALLALFWYELFYQKNTQQNLAMVGEKLPSFSLETVPPTNKKFTEKNLQGKVSLLNVWASWCYACLSEHPMLMKIAYEYHVPIYSINYRDEMNAARTLLLRHGNPYVLTGFDQNGDLAIDLGIYGTPETFVISPQGKILYRHIGAIDEESWQTVLYPLIKKYQKP